MKTTLIQKKIIYLNIVMLIVFLFGAGLGIWGFAMENISTTHTVILETMAVPMVSSSLTMWGIELRSYLKIRHTQEGGK